MKKLIFLSLCWLFPFMLYSQNEFFPVQKSIDWEQLEINLTDSLKTKLINSLRHPLIANLKDSKMLLKYFDNFHFVDFNLDGKTDIIYSGDVIESEGKKTFYWLKNGIDYKIVFETCGEIVIINNIISKVPVSFYIKYEPYDPSVVYLIDGYSLYIQNSTVVFKKICSSCVVKKTQIPSAFSLYIPFEVERQISKLRLTAETDTTMEFFGFEDHGNEIAEYSKGSIGYILSEKNDTTGNTWWFVLMLNNKSVKEFYHDWHDLTIHPKLPSRFFNVGWMNSRDLKRYPNLF